MILGGAVLVVAVVVYVVGIKIAMSVLDLEAQNELSDLTGPHHPDR